MAKENSFREMTLEEFNAYVDSIIENIESGKLNPKKIAPVKQNITIEDTMDNDSSVEISESEMIKLAEQEDKKNNTKIIGKPSKKLVVITDVDGIETIYGNAVICSDMIGIHPTTVRNRCTDQKVDDNGCLWSYRENDNI